MTEETDVVISPRRGGDGGVAGGGWNASLYDDKHGFVSKFGEDVVSWLAPQEGERILDLGCGTGTLANQISGYGAEVVGIDRSEDMISKARQAYPNIAFEVKDATDFEFDNKFDAVFSNAVLHWVNQPEKVIQCVYESLLPGGRFVLEMGGKHNVKTTVDAVIKVMQQEGLGHKVPAQLWYFPSTAEYSALLEKHGFTVTQVLYFKRDTVLAGDDGMADWIKMFGHMIFKQITRQQADVITTKAAAALKQTHWYNNTWHTDYVRLRVKAVKQR